MIRTLEVSEQAGLNELVWDLRIDPPYEVGEESGSQGGGRFGGPPQGPRVTPGSYQAVLSAGGQEWSTAITVLPDPRVQFTDADRQARQHALMSLYDLAEPVYLLGQRVRSLGEQVGQIQDLLGDDEQHGQLRSEADSIEVELDAINEAMAPLRQANRLRGAIQGSATRPTTDQIWQIDRAWEIAPELIQRVNTVIQEALPALNRQLNESGVRPDPGTAVPVPRRSGG